MVLRIMPILSRIVFYAMFYVLFCVCNARAVLLEGFSIIIIDHQITLPVGKEGISN